MSEEKPTEWARRIQKVNAVASDEFDDFSVEKYRSLLSGYLGLCDNEWDLKQMPGSGTAMTSTQKTQSLTYDSLCESLKRIESVAGKGTQDRGWKSYTIDGPTLDTGGDIPLHTLSRALILGEPSTLFGIPVYSTDLKRHTSWVPNRVHKRRRGQTEAYHKRVQKKWAKRWGVVNVTHAYLADLKALGLGDGHAMIVPKKMLHNVVLKARQCGLQSVFLNPRL